MNGLMRISRAGFLRACGAVVAGRGLNPLSVFAFADAPVAHRAAFATIFHEQVGTTAFAVDASGHRVPLTLAAVSDVRACGPFEQFSVTFHAPPGVPLADGIYVVRHAALGERQLFMAPVGKPTGERTVYEACFSRPAARGAEDSRA